MYACVDITVCIKTAFHNLFRGCPCFWPNLDYFSRAYILLHKYTYLDISYVHFILNFQLIRSFLSSVPKIFLTFRSFLPDHFPKVLFILRLDFLMRKFLRDMLLFSLQNELLWNSSNAPSGFFGEMPVLAYNEASITKLLWKCYWIPTLILKSYVTKFLLAVREQWHLL